MAEHVPRKEWLVVGALLVLSLALRLLWIGHVPPGVRFDELVNVKMADHIYAGEWPIYFQEAWGHEPLYHYFHALGMALLGQTVVGVRITSVLLGTLGVLTAYLLFRHLYGPAVGALTALLLSTSLWSLMYSRVGLRHISLPPLVCLSIYCLWRGLGLPRADGASSATADRLASEDGATAAETPAAGILWFVLGGVCTGLALYTYFASRVLPVILVVFVTYLALLHRHTLRRRWLGLVAFLVLPVLIVVPMALYLRAHIELEQRLGQVGGETLVALRAGDLRPLLKAGWATLRMFSIRGDPEWLYNISGRPVFGPASSVAFLLGLGLSLWRWRDARHALLAIWLVVGLSPSLLSWPPGSLGHTIVAQPAAMGLAALGLVEAWRWASRRSSRWLLWAGRLLVVGTVLAFVLHNTLDYFWRWPRFPEVRHEYQAPITAVARYLQQHPSSAPASVSAPYVDYWNPWSRMNLDLYAPDAQVRWFDGKQSLLFPADGEASFFLPDHLLLPSALDPDLEALLMSGAQPVEIGYRDRIGSSFDLYRWSDPSALDERLAQVSQSPAWASPETVYLASESEGQREALYLPVAFGERLELLGYAYERGPAHAGDTWRVTTYWRVLDAQHSPLAIFFHILDDNNAVRAGWDGLYVAPETWQSGDVVVHVHTLALPADLEPGMQRVEVGVYSPETLQRLSLSTGDGETTAPYDRALLTPLRIE